MCQNKKYRDSGALWRVMGWPSLASVIVNDSVTREAITRKQQRDLLKFIQEDKHFSEGVNFFVSLKLEVPFSWN